MLSQKHLRRFCFQLLIILLLFSQLPVSGQADSKPRIYPGWTLFVPGATHFYDHRPVTGLLFSATEVSGISLGIIYNHQLQTQSSTPYYNFPLLIGMQAYNVDKCDFLRNRMEVYKYYYPELHYDPVAFNELLKMPFQPKNIFTPITGGFVLVALAELYIGGRQSKQYFSDISQMSFFNSWMNRNPAMAIYGSTSLAASYGAGIAEEYAFRNMVLPLYDYRYGQMKGRIYSSLLFGSLHFSNLLFSEKPDYGAAFLQVAEASIAGYFLGRDVQKRGYKIGPAVSAHMWYDFTLMLGSFLIDPKNNFLGVNIKFNLN
ncbi:MAG: CPBP family intramembrane metalloprotease [Bacteroidales bacterium]|nr:CPBP family intramembrane metalloprotease [Bacteroidales bacterium]MCB9013004.1 CPBP family intramembrane metalloprotease [Bacteroidales bacterium]